VCRVYRAGVRGCYPLKGRAAYPPTASSWGRERECVCVRERESERERERERVCV